MVCATISQCNHMHASSFLASTGTDIKLIICVSLTLNFREVRTPTPKSLLMSLSRSKSPELIMTSCVRKDYSHEKGKPNTSHLKYYTLISMFIVSLFDE